jgi:hypothetical protein
MLKYRNRMWSVDELLEALEPLPAHALMEDRCARSWALRQFWSNHPAVRFYADTVRNPWEVEYTDEMHERNVWAVSQFRRTMASEEANSGRRRWRDRRVRKLARLRWQKVRAFWWRRRIERRRHSHSSGRDLCCSVLSFTSATSSPSPVQRHCVLSS